VGLRAGLDTEDRGKIICPCRRSNPDRPVVQSLVRLPELTRLQQMIKQVISSATLFSKSHVPSKAVFVENLLSVFLVLFPDTFLNFNLQFP
jgi:hypothetical protein